MIHTFVPSANTDNAAGLQALYDHASSGDLLRVRGGDCPIGRGVDWAWKGISVDIKMSRAVIRPLKVGVFDVLLTVGSPPGSSNSGMRWVGGEFHQGNVALQNVMRSRIALEKFWESSLLLLVDKASAYNRIELGNVGNDGRPGIMIFQVAEKAWCNKNTISRTDFAVANAPILATADTEHSMWPGAWLFEDDSFEVENGIMFHTGRIDCTFRDCYTEGTIIKGVVGEKSEIRILNPSPFDTRDRWYDGIEQ